MSELEFESLAPDSVYDPNKETFINAMDWALKNPKNKNIAITGSYGSGKSSIIETYINHHNIENLVAKVSISTFNKQTIEDSTKSINENQNTILIEDALEQQILQQLFYKVKPDKIPFSRFTKIYSMDKFNVLSIILFIFFMTFITFCLVKYNWLLKGYDVLNKGNGSKTFFVISFGLLLLGAYVYLSYIFLLWFQKIGVTKFGFGKTSIEVSPKEFNTVFSRYIDEIIYLFSKSEYKYVIFEDLDRFNNIGIFERLKGLNQLLNNTEQLVGKNLVFIYALRDDIFSKEDGTELVYNRTKFFDFIIPTVKIMHSSNAEDLLLGKLKSEIKVNESDIKLNRDFISDISLFINDMRILKNICNEYRIYKDALIMNGTTPNHLFSFIVYKNIYPGDYSSLLNNKGKVYNIFHSKPVILTELNNKISFQRNRLNLGFGTSIKNTKGIAALFHVNKNLSHGTEIIVLASVNNQHRFTVDSSNFNWSINLFEYVETLETFSIQINYRSSNERLENGIEFFNHGLEFNYLTEYKELLKMPEISKNEIENTIESLDVRIETIKKNSISYLLLNEIISANDIGISPLDDSFLYFIIRHGWLNESYEEYLTYFYPGSLSSNDIRFLQGVRNSLNLDYHLKLNNVEKVAIKIRPDDITSSSVFNYDLIKYLVCTLEENNNKLIRVIDLIFSSDENRLFYLGFIRVMAEEKAYNIVRSFIQQCIYSNKEVWNLVKDSSTSQELQDYIVTLINSRVDLTNTSNLKELRMYINEINPKILFNNCNKKAYLNTLRGLKIKHKDISGLNEDDLQIILNEKSYTINLKNCQLFLNQLNWTSVKNHHNLNVTNYIKDNIEIFIEDVLLLQQQNYVEDEKLFISLLNDLTIDTDLKRKLIKKINIRISNITSLIEISDIVNNNKLSCSLDNILYIINHDSYIHSQLDLDWLVKDNVSWEELLEDKKHINYLEERDFHFLINELLCVDSLKPYMLEELIEFVDRRIILDSENYNKIDSIKILIDNDNLNWSCEFYLESYSHLDSSLKIKYLTNLIEENIEDLEMLNNKGKLPWDNLLIEKWHLDKEERIIYFRNISNDVPLDYLRDNVGTIIPYDIRLNMVWSSNEANLTYFLAYLDSTAYTSDKIGAITELDFWDIKIFSKLRRYFSEEANTYLQDYIEVAKNDIFDTDDFIHILKSDIDIDDKVFVFINNYPQNLHIEDHIEDWIVNEKVFNKLDEVGLFEEVLKEFNSQSNISDALSWYLNSNNIGSDEIFSLLFKLPLPFSDIKKGNGRNKEFSNNEKNEQLFLQLKQRDIISRYIIEEDKILVNNKLN